MKKQKTQKGITLIALIITIIVLLILAIVAIAAIQDGGILQKAEDAIRKQELAEVREEVELALADAYVVCKTDKTKTLADYFNGKEGYSVDGNKITYKGYTFTIEDFKITDVEGNGETPVTPTPEPTITLNESEITLKLGETVTATIEATLANAEGAITWDSSNKNVATLDKEEGTSVTVTAVSQGETTITATYGENTTATCTVTVEEAQAPTFDPSTLTIGVKSATRTADYGKKVTDYTKVATVNGFTNSGVWRLFYQDEDFTYLITDDLVGNYVPSDYYEEYKTGADVSEVGEKLNYRIESFFNSNNTNADVRAVAWMTDPRKWSGYADDNEYNGDVVFAIGCPTMELYVASFNASDETEVNLSVSIDEHGYDAETEGGVLKTKYNNGIYNNGESYFWISSMGGNNDTGHAYCWFVEVGFSDYTSDGEFYINGDEWLWGWVENFEAPMRPVVAIPTDVFESKYHLETTTAEN